MRKFIFFILFFLIVTIFLGYRFFLGRVYNSTVSQSNLTSEFEIFQGMGLKDIGVGLEKAGLIKSQYYFDYYGWKTGLGKKIQAGKYQLSPNMKIPEMFEIFSGGKVKDESYKITVPEGYTNKKIVNLLKEIRPEIAGDFESIVTCRCLGQTDCQCDQLSSEYDFLKKIPVGVDMEGYLFPDTYFFDQNDSAVDLVKKFLDNFSEKISPVIKDKISAEGRTLHEVITLASIVEREVKTDKDRALVSGIFWQRIADEHPLQSCATLAYFLDVDKPQFSIEDTQIQSPYNTYLYKGLPPGPISNPGIKSIEAAVFPEKSDYYFFLSDPKTGAIIYSKNGQEHNENKLKYGL